jgi:hypothetical protein
MFQTTNQIQLQAPEMVVLGLALGDQTSSKEFTGAGEKGHQPNRQEIGGFVKEIGQARANIVK